ncbi:hypothetical protein NX79_10770 [Xanthomonas vasicola]|nr:hypothetical protein KWM_0115915 [Xanthomonas vasicola pv. musacearum NCPPB 2005]KFA18500.1 hypothetical protein KWS_0125225 [Xanthomonas vasicola pv. musacearum NCPPB 4384]KFA18577.1 hypothetical protein A11G_0110940 [Xanthomonas vasicola pv. musacearum NCPPB 4392]KFA18666.1 hypothetical protein KWU_0118840 [Xanthomonas vasicola pv. musacearum NCPPB 4394]KGR37812.1 hypothetical protein NX05_21255 [Xanthomonas vasicola]
MRSQAMKKSRSTEEQIAYALKQAELGINVTFGVFLMRPRRVTAALFVCGCVRSPRRGSITAASGYW